ncbi:MAG TPA: Bro-N domain-containing protein [Alphaproteobacteria bacterium]|jgi:prophage antirepressor-like protein
MNEIAVFDFEDEAVRAIEIDAEPWFVGRDVCRCLEISDHHQALGRLDDDEKGGYNIPTQRGARNMIVISEPGVYRLVFTSRTEVAERFKRWLAHEVLPALRRHGRFEIGRAPAAGAGGVSARMAADLAPALSMVREARHVFGVVAARALWRETPLPYLPEFDAACGGTDTDPEAEGGACLAYLLAQGVHGTPLAELVEAAPDTALAFGVRRINGDLGIASKGRIRALFAGTRWQDGAHAAALAGLAGAFRHTMKFGGPADYGVCVPWELVAGLGHTGEADGDAGES